MVSQIRIRSAKPAEKPYKLTDAWGLYVLVMSNGSRYWRFNYRFDGRQKTLALGRYPDVPAVKARERLQEARKLLADGIDPGAVKQAISRDFEAVARAWLAHWRTGRSERHVPTSLPGWRVTSFQSGSRPVSEITAAEFRNVAQKIERRGALEMARRLLQNCGQIMRYGVANDLVQRNPVADIRPADILKPRKKRNYPRVTARELRQLLRAMDGYVGGEHTRLALQLMALTFVRTSELIGARWPEFDLKQSR